MPGRHITDQQMRRFLTFKQTYTVPIPAAKAGFSQATAIVFKSTRPCHHKRRRRAGGGVLIRWPMFSIPRLCPYYGLHRGSGRLPFTKRLCGNIPNSAPPHGRMMTTLLAGIAQFERDLLSERVKSGLASARKRGKNWSVRRGSDRYQTRSLQRSFRP